MCHLVTLSRVPLLECHVLFEWPLKTLQSNLMFANNKRNQVLNYLLVINGTTKNKNLFQYFNWRTYSNFYNCKLVLLTHNTPRLPLSIKRKFNKNNMDKRLFSFYLHKCRLFLVNHFFFIVARRVALFCLRFFKFVLKFSIPLWHMQPPKQTHTHTHTHTILHPRTLLTLFSLHTHK